jgi:hypothetical protein
MRVKYVGEHVGKSCFWGEEFRENLGAGCKLDLTDLKLRPWAGFPEHH